MVVAQNEYNEKTKEAHTVSIEAIIILLSGFMLGWICAVVWAMSVMDI